MEETIELPPILPDIEEQLREYLICPEKLPIYDYRTLQEHWDREPTPTSLLNFEGSSLCTTLRVQRDPDTGKIIQFNEVPIQTVGANAKNSMALSREPLDPVEATMGSALNIPFWPGGFPDPISKLDQKNETLIDEELLTVAPGLDGGLEFEEDGFTIRSKDSTSEAKCALFKCNEDVVNLMDIIKNENDFLDIWNKKEVPTEDNVDANTSEPSLPDEEIVIPNEAPVVRISERTANPKDTEWAVLLDCSKPVVDFDEHVPNMAHTFKFELDTFQKLAIMHLEQHNHVFVAAHTSAGKTVVAEYAIALSKKHMTRTIYTSPIKALSNQKYRDFRRIFKDVGLITGDFQINQTAACLIMTTEILRSMLYNGSDVTRDLEYVIFDEVHYVNDAERGHVWEQVLILLPSHVTIIMLSATAPNTVEFADWLGRTKQKKVYVVSTSKRPVPLHHYLYTGTGGDSKDKRFLVLDQKGWHQEGYLKASETIEESPRNQTQHKLNLKQEKTMWCALIDHLSKKQLLPVVVFTFSRAQCYQTAMNLTHLDLTTRKEKSQIKKLFDDCIKSLKEPDRQLPQIITMRALLIQGIGVHHSGILPLIKEVVELLFQNNLVKLLFATETFAMGVNMPARTVIFNWIYKHDGQKFRILLPAEYIQMAGRAGRRGLDKEGTVIILCTKKLPSHSELREMMTGKPSQLQSQFRLTYGMVLSLLRVESLSVEGMMSRSFREADHQKKMFDIHQQLEEVEKKLNNEYNYELSDYLQPLIKFYAKASEYLEARATHIPSILCNQNVVKEMVPGRIILLTHGTHINKLGMLLGYGKSAKIVQYRVLVLTEENNKIEAGHPDSWYKMLSLAKENVFCPMGIGSHDVLTIDQVDVWEICDIIFKINAQLILKDWENRQIPRFKNDPPGPTCSAAIQDLFKLTLSVMGKNKTNCGIKYLHFIDDLKINHYKIYEDIKMLESLKEKTESQVDNVQIPNFEEQFAAVFKRKHLEDQRDQLKFQLSHASMTLYPDYESRIKLLKQLNYVSEDNRVQLKGRVACEMGMNELMITEIVFRNILNKLKPAEVAALMSSLVFQAKTKIEPDLTELPKDLIEAKNEIQRVFNQIQTLESKFNICNDIGRDEELNFGLIQVVYQWASDKPFSNIMFLTDVEEGIIVRCIQQLNDTICDVRNASRLIGDPELLTKMEEVSNAIKRDIVFAPSLYTQQEIHLIQ